MLEDSRDNMHEKAYQMNLSSLRENTKQLN